MLHRQLTRPCAAMMIGQRHRRQSGGGHGKARCFDSAEAQASARAREAVYFLVRRETSSEDVRGKHGRPVRPDERGGFTQPRGG